MIVVGAYLIKHYTDWGWTIWTGGFIVVLVGGLLALVAGVVNKWF